MNESWPGQRGVALGLRHFRQPPHCGVERGEIVRRARQQALRVRDTVSFAYQNGGASLLDFLGAQNDYRSVQLNYLNLIGAYLTAAGQLNLAVGREVIP